MAQAADQDNTNEPSIWRTLLILAGLLVIILGGYYLLGSGSQSDESTKNQPTTSEQEGDDSEGGEAEDAAQGEVSADDQQAAAREAEAAAQRGEVSQTLAAEGDAEFTYVVGSGESYTGLARQAVTATNAELSPVERIAAETKLAQDAGAEMLAAGQEVTLAKSTVKAAVEWAQSLSDEQKAAWQPYADMVVW